MQLSRESIQRMIGGANLLGGGGGGGGFDPSALAGYATQEWTASNYISIEFFGRLFQAYNGNTAVNPNDTTSTIDNIKAMFGFWTEQYISALGQGSGGGGGGGQGDVTWELLKDGNDERPIAMSHLSVDSDGYTSVMSILTGYTTSGRNYKVQKDADNHLFVNVPWTDNDHYDWADITNKPATATRWPAFSEVTSKPTTISGYGITDAITTANIGNQSVSYANSAGSADSASNADKLDDWYKYDILQTGYVCSNTANLSSYWGKAWTITVTSKQYADQDVVMLIESAYFRRAAIVLIKIRQEGANNSGAYAFNFSVQKISGNIPTDLIRLAVNNSTGVCDLWINVEQRYGNYNITILKKNDYRYGHDCAALGTLTTSAFTTAQSVPALSSTCKQMEGMSQDVYDLNVGGTIFAEGNLCFQRNVAGIYITNQSISWHNNAFQYVSNLLKSTDGAHLGLMGDPDSNYTVKVNGSLKCTSINIGGYVISADTTNGGLHIENAGLYADTFISALGQGSGGGGGGQGDVTWALLDDNSDNRQIAVSHLTGLLNGSFSGKDYAVKKDANNKIYVNVPWENTTYSAGTGLSLSGTTFSVKTPSSGAWFGGTAFVNSDGVMETGRYIDFHPTSASTLDYNVRLDAGTGTTARIFTFPDSAGTLLSNGNSSVSKNGETLTVKINGTSQSLTNTTYSADNGVGLSGTTFYNSGVRAATINGNYLRVNTNGTNTDLTIPYATNAGEATNDSDGNAINTTYLKLAGGTMANTNLVTNLNADLLDGTHKSDLFTVFTNILSGDDANKTSITIGGTNKKLTINYATNANSAAKLTTISKTAWGQTYWTANGVPDNISGNMSNVGDISFSASGKKIGGFLYFDTTNSRLGVGESSPAYKLHVAGTGYFTDNLTFANNKGIYMKDSQGEVNNVLYLASDNKLILGSETANEGYNTYLRGNSIYMQYGGANNGLLLEYTGNVGIGTTSPRYKLHVSGDVYATGGVTSLSDIRKKNVIDYELPLTIEQIADAPTIRFTWKDNREEGEQVGTIAQYWEKVLPQVTKSKNDELGMQYGVAALVGLIKTTRKVVDHDKLLQEQARKIEEQAKEIRELREELYKLKIA